MAFLEGITYESWITITQSIPFIILMILLVFVPFVTYILIAASTHARTADGRKLKSLMIQSANTWIAPIVWVFISIILILFVIFPFWLKFI